MFTLFVVLKLWAEMGLLSLLGQWVLGLLIGAKREGNLFYQLLGVLSLPFVWLVSRVGGGVMPAQHRRRWAAVLLGLLWLLATAGKISVCLQLGVAACA